MAEQLALALGAPPVLLEAAFYVSSANQGPFQVLTSWPTWPEGGSVYLYGPPTSGKSHLATLWQERSGAVSMPAKALSREDIFSWKVRRPLFVLEDLEDLEDQTALFHVLNLVKEKQGALLLTSAVRPGQLPFTLPDLRSRIRALPFLEIKNPDEDLLKTLLLKRFSDLHLKISSHVLDYTLKHLHRSYEGLDALVRLVDKLNWQEQRPLTIPLVKRALSLLYSE